MTGIEMMELAKKQREAKGLRCEWFIPTERRTFTAYARDEDQKAGWMADAESRGWVVVK